MKVLYKGKEIELIDHLEKGAVELDLLDHHKTLETYPEQDDEDLEKTLELELGDINGNHESSPKS